MSTSYKLYFNQQSFITNKTLLSKYSERQLVATYELLNSEQFVGDVLHLLLIDELVVAYEGLVMKSNPTSHHSCKVIDIELIE